MTTSRGALNPLALAVLELLHEAPRHPYEIQQLLRDRHTERLTKVSVGSLYHAVEKLERIGLIEAVETSREGRRPERTTYRITPAGWDAFAERLREMTTQPRREYPEFAAAVAYLHTLDQSDAEARLRQRLMLLQAEDAANASVAEQLVRDGLHPMFWINLEYEQVLRRAELAWVREVLDRLADGRLTWPACAGRPALHAVRDDEREETA